MREKWYETPATVTLAIVCGALIFHLAGRVRSVNAGAPPVPQLRPPVPAPRRVAARIPSGRDPSELPGSPVLNVDLYQELQSQMIAAPGRDPFSFEPTAQQLKQTAQARAADQAASAASSAAPSPPPPPPLPFKAVGYSVMSQGQIKAYLADSEQVYALVQGELFDKNYRVVRITPALIEIDDELYHRAVELPFPQ